MKMFNTNIINKNGHKLIWLELDDDPTFGNKILAGNYNVVS